MINHYRVHPTKLLNRRTLRMLSILAAVAAVCTAVMSALGALLMVRQLQLVALQRRTLPVLRQAAQLYLDQNAPASVPAPRRKWFRLPHQAKAAEMPVPALLGSRAFFCQNKQPVQQILVFLPQVLQRIFPMKGVLL